MTNPYNPSFGRKPERFLGRNIIVHEVLSALNNQGSPWRTTLLVGISGSGKTALLSDISESATSAEDCIVVSVTPEDNILDDILGQLHSCIPKSIVKSIPKPSKLTLVGTVELDIDNKEPHFLNNFRYQITSMLQELRKKKRNVLFLVDESQKHSAAMRTFAATYQHLIRENFDVSLIMAGLPNVISDILNDGVLTFLRRANQVVLDNVELSLVRDDFEEVFKGFDISSDILESAAIVTRGYPYLIQLVGFYMWEFLMSGTKPENILDKVTIHAKSMMFQNVHKLLYRELSPGDRVFINAMAADSNVSRFADIISRTGKNKNHLSTYRIRLIDHGYIKAVGRGEVAFSLPFTREFLIQEMRYAEL